MITRYRAWMDGEGLHDVDPAVIITDIRESKPEENIVTAGNGYRDGQRVLYRHREALSVTIRFMIREYDVARRKGILSRVLAWAHDGWLQINDRPEQRLRVVCEDMPAITSALKWTEELSVVFTAYAVPYWQETHAVSVSGSGQSGTVHLAPLGDMPCCLEANISNTGSGTLNILTLTAGNRSFAFSGLGLASGKTLTIRYAEDTGLLRMEIEWESVMNKRTAASADDLLLYPGSNTITFTADQQISGIFKARGLWR